MESKERKEEPGAIFIKFEKKFEISHTVQGLRWHGFEGFDRTRQFLEKGSRTRQFWGIYNTN